MEKSTYSFERVEFALKQAETRTPVVEVLQNRGYQQRSPRTGRKSVKGSGGGELRPVKQLKGASESRRVLDRARVPAPDCTDHGIDLPRSATARNARPKSLERMA
jgi:putative transposase